MSADPMNETFKAMLGALNRIEHLLQDHQMTSGTKNIKEANEQIEGFSEQEDDGFTDNRESVNEDECTFDSASKSSEVEPVTETRGVCDVSEITEFKKIVGGGSRIPSDGRLTLHFTQNYLECITLEEANKKLAELSTFKQMLDFRALEDEKRIWADISSSESLEGWSQSPGIRFDIMDFNLSSNISPSSGDVPECKWQILNFHQDSHVQFRCLF